MESINKEKFEPLNKAELNKINGGGWSKWKLIYSDEEGSIFQRYICFGLIGTTETLAD